MESHRWVELVEPVNHHIDIGVLCACAVYRVAKPTYMIVRLGRDATIGDALRRLYCPTCGERLTFNFSFEWGYDPARHHHREYQPLPDWFIPHFTIGPRAEQLRDAFGKGGDDCAPTRAVRMIGR